MKRTKTFTIILLWLLTAGHAHAVENTVSLAEIEILALENDPMLSSFAERRHSMQALAIADAQLPDPLLKIGAANLPLTSFNLNQEPMTQLQLGLSQQFPRGDTLRLRGERASAQARLESQNQNSRLLSTLLAVRVAWFEAYYWQNNIVILEEQFNALEELVGITQAHYATGGGQQQDVLRAQLELDLLRDKILDAERQYKNSLAMLNRWGGPSNTIVAVSAEHTNLKPPQHQEQTRENLINHPVIGVQDAEVLINEVGVNIAHQAYKPAWGVDLNYGARASDQFGQSRPDFVSLMVKFDIPFFTGNRQDKRLLAAKHMEQSTRFNRTEQLRQLTHMLDNSWSNWRITSQRLQLYSVDIQAHSSQTYAVTLAAYRNKVAEFSLLIRARLLDFNTQLQVLALSTELEKAKAHLLYLQGEE